MRLGKSICAHRISFKTSKRSANKKLLTYAAIANIMRALPVSQNTRKVRTKKIGQSTWMSCLMPLQWGNMCSLLWRKINSNSTNAFVLGNLCRKKTCHGTTKKRTKWIHEWRQTHFQDVYNNQHAGRDYLWSCSQRCDKPDDKTGEKEEHLIKSKKKKTYILIQKLQPHSSKVKRRNYTMSRF